MAFDDLPQFPFSRFNMHLFGSERGVLATPIRCGTYPGGKQVQGLELGASRTDSKQYFTLESGPNGAACPGGPCPSRPAFLAGVADKTAGVHAPFSVSVIADRR